MLIDVVSHRRGFSSTWLLKSSHQRIGRNCLGGSSLNRSARRNLVVLEKDFAFDMYSLPMINQKASETKDYVPWRNVQKRKRKRNPGAATTPSKCRRSNNRVQRKGPLSKLRQKTFPNPPFVALYKIAYSKTRPPLPRSVGGKPKISRRFSGTLPLARPNAINTSNADSHGPEVSGFPRQVGTGLAAHQASRPNRRWEPEHRGLAAG